MTWAVFIAAAFLCGSIPTGLLIARSRGVDIRRHGSGNIGATNVARVLGPRLGLVCFIIDVGKGFAPTLAAGLYHDAAHLDPIITPAAAWWWLGVLAASIAGHMFTPFAGFRGGKGVATGLGALLGVYPYLTVPGLGALVVWAIVAAIWRYVGLASVVAAIALPFFVMLWGASAAALVLDVPRDQRPAYLNSWVPFLIMTSFVAALVVVRHRANLRRTLAGTESKIGQRVDPHRSGPAPHKHV
jgi:glycerol-3-phosphate acyltransferase PlsY